jgi:hypothetical protein
MLAVAENGDANGGDEEEPGVYVRDFVDVILQDDGDSFC